MAEDLQQIAHDESRPLPVPNVFSEPFWAAARRHELTLQRCGDCGTVRYYPRPRCPTCLSARAAWEQLSGRGAVYSFSIVHRPLGRWFASKVPLVVAIVELDEGVRMMTNIVGCAPDEVHIGMPVTVQWEDVNEEISLPMFGPAAGDG